MNYSNYFTKKLKIITQILTQQSFKYIIIIIIIEYGISILLILLLEYIIIIEYSKLEFEYFYSSFLLYIRLYND